MKFEQEGMIKNRNGRYSFFVTSGGLRSTSNRARRPGLQISEQGYIRLRPAPA